MIRPLSASALLCAVALVTRVGSCCSCGTPSLDSALTQRGETWGVRLSERAELAHGTWNAHGAYRAFGPKEYYRNFELSLLAAWRPIPRLEFNSQVGYGRSTLAEGGLVDDLHGASDWFTHARWEVLDQTPTWSNVRVPLSVALIAGVLAPLGRADPSLNRGLGAWELSLGSALDHDLSSPNRLSVFVEAGLRLADRSLAVERRLGPRVYAQATASHFAGAWTTSAFSSLRWEGDAALDGRTQPGSGMRLWQVGLAAAFQATSSPLRPACAIRYAPHVSGIGVNTTASTLVDLSLSYTN